MESAGIAGLQGLFAIDGHCAWHYEWPEMVYSKGCC